MMRALVFATLLAPSVVAAQSEPRNKAWYLVHPTTLDQTLRVCHSDARYSRTPDCINAEGAAAGRLAQQTAPRHDGGVTDPYSPAYWSSMPIARGGVMAQCRRRAPGDEMVFPFCAAAAQSAMQDAQRH